jgi:hypothetical protein
MHSTVRRTLALTVAVGAMLAVGTSLAYADTGSDDGDSGSRTATPAQQSGTGSGLSGGPTHTQVLQGAPAVPLSDPTLGEGTALPPVYNAVSSLSG